MRRFWGRLDPISVSLVLVGLNRSLSFTEASIRRELVKPLMASPNINFSPSIFLLAPPQGFVTNVWSGEHGPVEKEVPLSLGDIPIHFVNQDHLAAQVRSLAEKCLQIEDTWRDNGVTILNSLVFLKALSLAKRLIAKESQVVIFARPDIKIERGLRVVRHVQRVERSRMAKAPESLFPAWHGFGGLNDRFAILPREHIDRYFGRVGLLPALLAENRPYHSERFLFDSFHDVKYANSIETTMVRIRVGGRPEQSDVELVRKRKWYRKRVKAFWKHKALPALRTLWTVEGNH